MSPVTGMLTVYEDQLRFDRAVDSAQSAVDSDVDGDDSMSRVRLNRQLINSVDISDSSPQPHLFMAKSVCLSLSLSLSLYYASHRLS